MRVCWMPPAPPTSDRPTCTTPGSVKPTCHTWPPVGIVSSSSRLTTCDRPAFCTSTSGASPVTVMLSSMEPTFISPFTVAVALAVSVMPSRRNVLKPCSVNVTV